MGLGARLRFLLRADLKAIAEGRAHETHIRNQFEQKARVGEVLLLSLSPLNPILPPPPINQLTGLRVTLHLSWIPRLHAGVDHYRCLITEMVPR